MSKNTNVLKTLDTFVKGYTEAAATIMGIGEAGGDKIGESFKIITDDIAIISDKLATIPAINLKAKLTAFGKDLWTGKGAISVEHKPIVIKVNLDVSMSPKKVAEGLKGEFATAAG